MQKAFENSCAKGCLVYIVALVLILVLSAVGLGGLTSRFGAGAAGNTQPTTATTQAGQAAPTSPQQAPAATSNSTQADAGLPQQAQPTATPQPAVPPAAPQVQPQTQPTQSAPPPPVASSQGTTVQTDVQGGGISGQATSPFYIVQPGDTLWDIAGRFGTTVDALRAANKLGEEFIKPNQLLYLVQEQIAPAQPAQQPTPAPSGNANPGAGGAPPPVESGTAAPPVLPQMPSTGINTRP